MRKLRPVDPVAAPRPPGRPPEVAFVAVTTRRGSLTIMQIVLNDWIPVVAGGVRQTSDEVTVNRLIRKHGIKAASWRVIDPATLPTIRVFRDAWADTGTDIVVDMPRAREIAQAQIRAVRNAKLKDTDAAVLKSAETGKSMLPEVVAERQRLRDAPADPRLAAAADPAALEAAMQAIIKGL